MNDLKVLAQEGEAQEYLLHAKNIRPSERLEDWKTLTLKMALKWGDELVKSHPITRLQFLELEEYFTWPLLNTDASFITKRDKIGFNYLINCYSKGQKDQCLKDLQLFWSRTSSEFSRQSLSLQLAEIIRTEHPEVDLIDFFRVVIITPNGAILCKNKIFQDFLEERLGTITSLFQNWPQIFEKLNKTADIDCWKKITPSAGLNTFILKKYLGTLSPTEKDTYHLVYLLESPSPGEIFNESWNILKSLGRDNNRREQTLSALKKLDPLPDQLISSESDIKKAEIITAEFSQNFPEYFDFYLRQCLSFFRGTGNFPDGNPTPNCRKFVRERAKYLNASLVNDINSVFK
jgi:hypothetical protein